MMMNLLMSIFLYPAMLIVYAVLRINCGAEGGYYFAASVKPEWLKNEEVKKIGADFKRRMRIMLAIFAVLPFAAFFVPYTSIQYTIWMMWMTGMLIAFFVPFVRANAAMKYWKTEHGYYNDEQKLRYVELRTVEQGRGAIIYYLIPTGISLLVTGIACSCVKEQRTGFLWFAASFILINLIICLVGYMLAHTKEQVISQNSDVNVNYTRARKRIWRQFCLENEWLNTACVIVISVVFALECKEYVSTIVITLVYSLITLVLAISACKAMKRVQKAYGIYRDIPNAAGDDWCWIGGIAYYNPEDTHVMVEKRNGMGTTMNMASKGGLAMMIFSAVCLLLIPFSCLLVIAEEFTPIHLRADETAVYAEHIFEEYRIPVKQMEEVTLVKELPEWSKKSGTGMDRLEKGTFRIKKVGDCEVCLNPENTKFICIKTASQTYYFSGYDDAETEAVYQTLLQQMQ